MTLRILGIIATENQVKNNEPTEFISNNLHNIDWHQGVKESNRWNLSEFPDQPIKANDNKIKEVLNRLDKIFIRRQNFHLGIIKKELNKKTVDRFALSVYLDLAGTRSSNLIDMRENCAEYIIDFDKWAIILKNNDFLCLFDVHE